MNHPVQKYLEEVQGRLDPAKYDRVTGCSRKRYKGFSEEVKWESHIDNQAVSISVVEQHEAGHQLLK